MLYAPNGSELPEQRPNGKEVLSDLSRNELHALSSVLIQRAAFAFQHGFQFGEDRDLYERLGYRRQITLYQMQARYERGDIAQRIVDCYPAATWAVPPIVREDDRESSETKFEKQWKSLVDRLHLWSYLDRMDRVSGIGHYGILLLGVADGRKLEEPIGPGKGPEHLIYLRPYSELTAGITRFVEDENDPRFGLPLLYNLTPGGDATTSVNSSRRQRGPKKLVHWSRVLHFSDALRENDVYGLPRLLSVFNRLDDLDKVSGGSAEALWRSGYRGFHADIPPNAKLTPASKAALDERLKEYEHGQRRWIQTEGGVQIDAFDASQADPTGQFKMLIALISGATGIPQRILMGSEQGRLASDQDRLNWSERVRERTTSIAIPFAVRALIDRLLEIGVLSKPTKGYKADPPDIRATTPEVEAKIVNLRSQAVERFTNTSLPAHEWRPWVGLPAQPTPPPEGTPSGE